MLCGDINLTTEATIDDKLKLSVFSRVIALTPEEKADLKNSHRLFDGLIVQEDTIHMTLMNLAHEIQAESETSRLIKLCAASFVLRSQLIGYKGHERDWGVHEILDATGQVVDLKKIPEAVMFDDSRAQDSSWTHRTDFDASIVTDVLQSAVKAALTSDNLTKVGTLIIAAKIRLFRSSKHVRQKVSPYIRQLAATQFPKTPMETLIRLIDQVSQWASTRAVFAQMDVPNVADYQAISFTQSSIRSADVRLHLTGTPAGTGRTSLAYELFMEMMKHPVAEFMPDITDFDLLKGQIDAIKLNPLHYHIDASYLCKEGKNKDFDDTVNDSLLGRLGTFGACFYPDNPIMKNPRIANGKYQKYIDFDFAFQQLCQSYKIQMGCHIKNAQGKV